MGDTEDTDTSGILTANILFRNTSDLKKPRLRQDIINNINFDVLTNVIVSTVNNANITNISVKNIEVELYKGCKVDGNFKISQESELYGSIYKITNEDVNTTDVNKLKNLINKQLDNSVKNINPKVYNSIKEQLKAKMTKQVSDSVTNIFNTTVSNKTIVEQLSINNIYQDLVFKCRSTFKKDFTIKQTAQIDITMVNIVNNVITQIVENPELNDLIDGIIIEEEVKYIKPKKNNTVLIISAVVIVVLIIIIIIIAIVYYKNSSNEQYPNGQYPNGQY